MTRIGVGLSTSSSSVDAGIDAARVAKAGLDAASVDLAFVFLSPAHFEGAAQVAEGIRSELSPRRLLGCVAEGVVSGSRELEDGPGVAVWAASLPEAEIETFHAVATIGDDDISLTGIPAFDEPALVTLLVDPFTFPTGSFIDYVNDTYPGLPLVGGIAAGGRAPGTQALIHDGEIYDEGALGAVVSGVPIRTVVSQGCAPIGRDAVITQAEGNVVFELAGKPALERLREEIAALPREQQVLAAQGLLAGLVIDENKPEYGPGDFLIRGLLGADEETGALAVGEAARVGQTLRFHVRDATTAEEELRTALAEALAAETPAGALLFTCNGRGTRMFPAPDHDAKALAEALGSPTLAGFFCGGEIGPVGGRAFLHGFTATMAVFL